MSSTLPRRSLFKLAPALVGASLLRNPGGLTAQGAPSATHPATSYPFTNLSINENQFGPSPRIREAMIEAIPFAHEYPDEPRDRLTALIAQRNGIQKHNVLIGAGSADVLYGAGYYFGLQGGEIVSSDPSFHILSQLAERVGATLNFARFGQNHAIDLNALKDRISEKTRMVYICNPENPTGTLLDPEELKAFCREVCATCPVVIDEAYLDYAGRAEDLSMISLVKEGYPVVITRTFSKGFGLGGMRVGYAVSTPELARGIGRCYVTGIGCGASRLSIEAAIAAYEDTEHADMVYRQNRVAVESLEKLLRNYGLEPVPSWGGFVLTPVAVDSKGLAEGIFFGSQVRISPRNYFGQNYLRISTGRPDQIEQLERGLRLVFRS